MCIYPFVKWSLVQRDFRTISMEREGSLSELPIFLLAYQEECPELNVPGDEGTPTQGVGQNEIGDDGPFHFSIYT